MPYPDAKYPYDQRLIEAAPKLLECLDHLVRTLDIAWDAKELAAPKYVQCQLGEEVKRSKRAIAKAEGRESE